MFDMKGRAQPRQAREALRGRGLREYFKLGNPIRQVAKRKG